MRSSLISFLGFATVALAQTAGFDVFYEPKNQSSWKVGDVLSIAWTPSAPAGKITLTLIGGSSSSDLAPVVVIAQSINSTPGTLAWPIPPNVGSFASYGVNLTLDSGSDFQYSSQFYITGGLSSSASSTGTASDSTTTSTTRMTSTITVANTTMTTSASVTGSMSNNLTMTATPTKGSTSSSASVTATGTGSATTPSSSKSAGEGLRARVEGAALVGMGGVMMAFLL